jgi:deoxyribodipyrimidine photolyase-related protein
MVNRLVLVLGDQLSTDLTALKQADRSADLIVMAEVMGEGTYVPHHPKKIALILSAMRHFAEELRADGWQVAYTRLDDAQNTHSLNAELLRRASETGATEIIVTQPGEWRLHNVLSELPIPVRMLPDDRFICGLPEIQNWAKGRKSLRMEYFYREMRRKTGLLMDGDQPLGDKWNFDHDNRKPAQDDLLRAAPMQFEPDAITQDVLKLVEQRFDAHFGTLRPFWFAVTREDALRALDHFVTHLLAGFGDYQDAMLQSDRFLHHSILSPYLNIGLLSPLEVCQRVEDAYHAGQVPLNAAEGYIRQVIGWREYVRGIYFMEGPDYVQRNALDHQRKVPDFYWGEPTRMNCVSHAVAQTRDEAYAHHIQRLMVTGNFALLAGVNPTALHEWYLAVYADAFEWVEAPNTVGMSQFADGGLLGSKPYVSSGNYINKMSDYCGSCSYSVTTKTGKKACPFNLLYWHFLMRHRARFERNPRMAQMYRTWDRMAEDKRATILRDAEVWLADLDTGRPV